MIQSNCGGIIMKALSSSSVHVYCRKYDFNCNERDNQHLQSRMMGIH